MSFAVFCFVCLAAGIGINFFLFQSTIIMEMDAQVGRGTLTVTGRPVRQSLTLTNGDDLSTDLQTQSTVLFRDSENADRLVASVTLRGNTDLVIRRAIRPRYDWSTGNYNIELQDLSGVVDIYVARDLDRTVRLTINTRRGELVDIGESGQYVVSVTDNQTRVVNRKGQVFFTPANTNIGHAIPIGNHAIWDTLTPSEVVISPAFANLLTNSTFEEVFPIQAGSESEALAVGWVCTNTAADPPGSYHAEVQDGRPVLRLVRANNAITNGETRCWSWFPDGGYDVNELTSLSLRTSFNIHYQSLAACGFEGSECPLMLQVDYIDARGEGHRWYHGFFYAPQPDYPQRCDSCFEEHERVNEKAWYTYDSGNWLSLFTPLPPDQRPVTILNVQFYASGHQYDVYMGEVALLAGQ